MSTDTSFVSDIGQLCGRCLPEVLETMFFAMAVESEDARVDGDSLAVRLVFRGSQSGVFGLKADRSVVASIGAAFLGKFDEGDLTGDEVSQVACELANMVCGAVLSEAESETGFELDEPQLDGEPFETVADYEARFEVDTGGAVEIRFRLDGAPRARA